MADQDDEKRAIRADYLRWSGVNVELLRARRRLFVGSSGEVEEWKPNAVAEVARLETELTSIEGARLDAARAVRSARDADPFVRLGAWLADRERGPGRKWRKWPPNADDFWGVRLIDGIELHYCEGPTLESALTAALDKAGA